MSRVIVLAIYFNEEDREKVEKILKPIVPKLNAIGEVTEPYNGPDRDDLFSFIQRSEDKFIKEVKDIMGLNLVEETEKEG